MSKSYFLSFLITLASGSMMYGEKFVLVFNFLLIVDGSAGQSNAQVNHIEPIPGNSNYRYYGKHEYKPWRDQYISMCTRPARCIKVDTSSETCLGSRIQHEYTSLDLTDFRTSNELADALEKYYALKYLPKCWEVLQPFICSVFKPECEALNSTEMVYLPSMEMCQNVMEQCRLVYSSSFFIPEFLRCNIHVFPSKCRLDVREMKTNESGVCMKPTFVPTNRSANYFPGIDGCGIQCRDPMYADSEYQVIKDYIFWGSAIAMACNFFAIATFLLEWRSSSKYPAIIVFYINLCLLIAGLGWITQFVFGSNEIIVCRKDGTLRHSEPTPQDNLICVTVFVLMYYFPIAAMAWFVLLTYSWHLRAAGNVQERINSKSSYFHLIAWTVPLAMCILAMVFSKVDGNSLTGICFLGSQNVVTRIALLLAPLCAATLVAFIFTARGVRALLDLENYALASKSNLKSTAAIKIRVLIVRMIICTAFLIVSVIVSTFCQFAEFRQSNALLKSLNNYILCTLENIHDSSTCTFGIRPNIQFVKWQLICFFASCVLMSSWCFSLASFKKWSDFLFCRNTDARLSKHKAIARIWAKRNELSNRSRLSISLRDTRSDPVGMNFDFNAVNNSQSLEISSSWINHLPNFIKRRMALAYTIDTRPETNREESSSSIDSELSFSIRQLSVESRRNSAESQISFKVAELKTNISKRRAHSSRSNFRNKRSKSIKRAAIAPIEDNFSRTEKQHKMYATTRGQYTDLRRGAVAGLSSDVYIPLRIKNRQRVSSNQADNSRSQDQHNGSNNSTSAGSKLSDSKNNHGNAEMPCHNCI